ncbi:MAG: hypothetical protein WCO82_06055 [Sphingomonadales bacterium]|jgi:hypothetical protein
MNSPARRAAGAPSRASQIAQISLGGLLLLLAPVLGVVSPGPFGTIVFALGFALVLKNSRRARRRYVRASRRYPRLQKAVNFGLRRKRGKAALPAPATAAASLT